MVGEEEFVEGFAGCQHSRRGGLHLHVRLALANAGGLVGALAAVHHADAAYRDGNLVLLVAEGWDRNAVQPGGVEDGRSVGNGYRLAVDGAGECRRMAMLV